MNPHPAEALRLPDDFPLAWDLVHERIGMIAHRAFMFVFWYAWFMFFLSSLAAAVAVHHGWTPPPSWGLKQGAIMGLTSGFSHIILPA